MLKQSGQLGGKCKGAFAMKVVKRLLAKPVARQKNPPLHRIENRKRPHTIEAVQHRHSPLAPGLKKDLGIRVVCLEPPPFRLQLLPQLGVVVNLAVEDNHRLPVGGAHRLGAACKVDNREAAVAEENSFARFLKITLGIWPTMGESTGHAV